jgi:hypothetical protein
MNPFTYKPKEDLSHHPDVRSMEHFFEFIFDELPRLYQKIKSKIKHNDKQGKN